MSESIVFDLEAEETMVADAAALTTATKSVLREIAKHAHALALGLQNAAPPQDGGPNRSVQYLTEIAAELEALSRSIDGLSANTEL